MVPTAVVRWKSHAESFRGSLEANLVLAVIWQESMPAGDQWSYRYEPNYQYFYDHKNKRALYDKALSVAANRNKAIIALGTTEFNQQSASWGLMQVMGAVARERGFTGWLTRLCDPEEGVRVGCSYLNDLFKRTGNVRDALRRYNGSSIYADHVLEKLKSIRES